MTANVLDFNNALPLAVLEEHLRRREVDAEDVKARITASAQSFVEWLFSGRALVKRGEARIGDTSGAPGASLAIQLEGSNAGLWHDHSTGEGGDLIALFQAYMGYDGNRNFVLAVKEIAAEFLRDPVDIRRGPTQRTVEQRIGEKKAKLGTKPRADMVELGAPVATWRYVDLKGNQIASVVRFEPDGTPASKTYRPFCRREINGRQTWAPGVPDLRPLYNLPDIATASTVILCEGEKAAQALADLGIAATTAMQGAEAPIEKTDWSPLNGKTVIVWPDNDAPGFKYSAAVTARLVALGCTVRIVPVPQDATLKWDAADAVAEGRDVRALIESAVVHTKAEKPRIRILDIDELEDLPPPTWQVDQLVPQGGLVVLWGRSGDLKSWVANDLCMRVSTGTPWFGRETRQGLVLYVAAEGAYGFGSRVRAWRRFRGEGLRKPQFKLIPHSVALTSDDLEHLVNAIIVMAALEGMPVLIVLDTLARTFGVGDENKQADMNAYVSAADKLREATGATVLIVHHSGVGDGQRERGSSVLRGAADAMLKVARDGDRLTVVNRSPEGKQKDAEEAEDIQLRVQKVVYEHDGSEHTTLLLMEDDNPLPPIEAGERAPVEHKFGPVEQAVFDALKQAGEPLGLNRILLMSGQKKNSVGYALRSLVEKKAIQRLPGDGDSSAWTVA